MKVPLKNNSFCQCSPGLVQSSKLLLPSYIKLYVNISEFKDLNIPWYTNYNPLFKVLKNDVDKSLDFKYHSCMSHDKSGIAVPGVEMFNTQEAQQDIAAKSRQPA